MYVVIELKRFYEHNSVSHGIYFRIASVLGSQSLFFAGDRRRENVVTLPSGKVI